MKPEVRAAIAAMAIAHSRKKNISSVYDYKNSRYVKTSATINGSTIDGYDYDVRCHFGGTFPDMYHYGTRKHIELKHDGPGKYSGYDYDERCHFSVDVQAGQATVYDYGEKAYFSYSA